MAYPTVVMEIAAGREVLAIDSWSTPQIIAGLDHALDGTGPALSTTSIPRATVERDVALIVTTSGSTGTPKMIAHTAESLIFNARATHKYLGATKGESWSLLLPLTHIAGLNVLIRARELGTNVLTISDRADYTAIVPTQLHRALSGDTELLTHLKGCKAILVGGGPLDPALRMKADEAGLRVIATYGMSESCGGVVYDGVPLDGISISIIDGRIALKGPQISRDVTGSDGWFITSDSGTYENGFLTVNGRIDDQIISGGEKISLSAVEAFLQEEYGSTEIVAFAKPDAEWGERLCIATTIDLPNLDSQLKLRFGPHVSPKEIIRVDSIPYVGIGKPDRKKLANDNA